MISDLSAIAADGVNRITILRDNIVIYGLSRVDAESQPGRRDAATGEGKINGKA